MIKKALKSLSITLILAMVLASLPAFPVFAGTGAGTGVLHPAGCIPDSWDTILNNLAPPRIALRSALPSSVDLSGNFPPPGNQGDQGSCTAWAVGYNLKTYQEQVNRNWGVSADTHKFSPGYIYNQLCGGVDDGIHISDAMRLVVSQGVCTLASFPFSERDWVTQPTAGQRAEAAQYKCSSWNAIIGTESIKQRLAGGEGVVIAVAIYPDFDNISASNPIFDEKYGSPRGGHSICLVGYDDGAQAYKFVNSWGDSWGLGGYGWIAYDMLYDSAVNWYGVAVAYVMVTPASAYKAVTDITDVPAETTAGAGLRLTGTVVPPDAASKSIVWTVADAGETGAAITGDTLNTTAAGTVRVLATIADGAAIGAPFTKWFDIVVKPAEPVELESIQITSPPDKVVYFIGEALILDGLTVTGTYSDGSVKQEIVTMANVSGFDSSTANPALAVTVTVGGKSDVFYVEIKESILESIQITSLPDKVVYFIGEALILDGLTVTGTYSDGTVKQETVTMVNISGFDSSAVNPALAVTVTVGGKTAVFYVEIKESVLENIQITSLPEKTSYFIGEALILDGLTVTGTYSDGSVKQETITMANVSGFDNSAANSALAVTITVGGKTAVFYVEIKESVLESIQITSPPEKTSYFIGEALALDGLTVTGTYSDRSVKQETITMANISGFDSSAANPALAVTVTVGGKSAVFYVEIKESVLDSIQITSPPEKTSYFTGEALILDGLAVTGTYSDGSVKQETITMANVSGFDSSAANSALAVTVTAGGKTAVFYVEIKESVLQSIQITSPPDKVVYFIGEALILNGLAVTGTYSDGSVKPEPVTMANIIGFDNSAANSALAVTITIGGKSAVFYVEIKESVLENIQITLPPEKVVYFIGEALILDGLAVTGTYSDGSVKQETVTIANISGFDSSTANSALAVTVIIGGKTAVFYVEINESVLESIQITSPPDKVSYFIGEALILDGLTVTGTYSDGSVKQETVTIANISGFDSSTANSALAVTVTVGGKTAVFYVEIKESVLESIQITSPPEKTSYFIGEALVLDGLTVTGTYSDGSVKPEPVTMANISGFDSSAANPALAVTITVGGKTAVFYVEIIGLVSKTLLNELIADIEAKFNGNEFYSRTAASIAALRRALDEGKAVSGDVDATQREVDDAYGALLAALSNMPQATLVCAAKSALAKVAKLQTIPYTWDGAGAVTFSTSNAAVCGVTPDGTLIPLKAGIAVITITAPNNAKIVLAVTVSA